MTSEVEPNDEMTAAGYDEAVEKGIPFSAEPNIRAEDSADPVALTEADPMTVDELVLQEAGRDLRPDVIAPAPDITTASLADLEAAALEEEFEEGDAAAVDSLTESPTSSALESSFAEKAATDESLKDEKQ